MINTHDSPVQNRVAIVGTGLAGLTTAHLLHNDQERRYRVTLFEQSETLSFDSASVAVRDARNEAVERIDVPMRASAGGYYANLMSMYRHLGIPLHPVRFLFVFAKAVARESEAGTYFIHASNLHQTPPPWPGNRGVLAHFAEIVYLILCHFWFSVACFIVRPRTGENLADYLQRIWLPRRFASQYLLPLMSSVSTCTHDEMLAFPASDIVSYKKLSHGRQHYVVCGGVEQVQSRLADGIDDIRLRSRVLEIAPRDDGSQQSVVRWQAFKIDGTSHISEEVFDRVVLAVSPDVAGRIYRPLANLMATMPTVRVETLVLPPSKSVKAGTEPFSVVRSQDSSATKCMHHSGDIATAQTITLRTRFSTQDSPKTEALHTMPSGVVVQTCPLNHVDPKTALQTAAFTRTLRTTNSQALVKRIMGREDRPLHDAKEKDQAQDDWVNGQDNVWLTGAWCWDGMVLLEGCVVSAMMVAESFGVDIPWQT